MADVNVEGPDAFRGRPEDGRVAVLARIGGVPLLLAWLLLMRFSSMPFPVPTGVGASGAMAVGSLATVLVGMLSAMLSRRAAGLLGTYRASCISCGALACVVTVLPYLVLALISPSVGSWSWPADFPVGVAYAVSGVLQGLVLLLVIRDVASEMRSMGFRDFVALCALSLGIALAVYVIVCALLPPACGWASCLLSIAYSVLGVLVSNQVERSSGPHWDTRARGDAGTREEGACDGGLRGEGPQSDAGHPARVDRPVRANHPAQVDRPAKVNRPALADRLAQSEGAEKPILPFDAMLALTGFLVAYMPAMYPKTTNLPVYFLPEGSCLGMASWRSIGTLVLLLGILSLLAFVFDHMRRGATVGTAAVVTLFAAIFFSLPSMSTSPLPFMLIAPASLALAILLLGTLLLVEGSDAMRGLALMSAGALCAGVFSAVFLGPLYGTFELQDWLFNLTPAVLLVVVAAIVLFYEDRFSRLMYPTAEAEGARVVGTIHERCAAMSARYSLTARESQVLDLLAEGRNEPYVERALSISRATVKTHITHIYRKVGVSSRQELLDELLR